MLRTLVHWNPRTAPQWKPPPLLDLKYLNGTFVTHRQLPNCQLVSFLNTEGSYKAYTEDGGNRFLINTGQTTQRHNLQDHRTITLTGHDRFHTLQNSSCTVPLPKEFLNKVTGDETGQSIQWLARTARESGLDCQQRHITVSRWALGDTQNSIKRVSGDLSPGVK
jgi:hypothetical protein